MAEFNWMTALIGGILIGISSTMMLGWNGRITGISGMVHGLVSPRSGEIGWRWIFLISMIGGGALYEFVMTSSMGVFNKTPEFGFAPIAMIIGGLLVGFGTRMGGGCTSGHGVCGLGRLSPRSFAAVITFLTTGIMTVYIIRHLLKAIM